MIFFSGDNSLTRTVRGRLAPSPTGYMHLGNAWAFWAACLAARSSGGECVLRFEDIDPARAKLEFATALLADLAWLGLARLCSSDGAHDWDESYIVRQSARVDAYENALTWLREKSLVYPCYCTRKELRDIAGAPHVDDVGAPYPGVCRNLSSEERARKEAEGRRYCFRLICPPDVPWTFEDRVMGSRCMTLAECGGDFALRRSDGVFAYQLAVVVDDIDMGVTQVVRGDDILSSTPRQLYLYSLFGAAPPEYAHVPLVTDENGDRLAKRHVSLTVRSLQEAGVFPETILGWLAVASGLRDDFALLHAEEGVNGFSFKKIRPEAIRLPADPIAFFLRLQKG